MKKSNLYMGVVLLSVISIASYGQSGSEVKEINHPLLAQNANYIPCYKEQADFKKLLFRWCPTGYPWTATNETRTSCYATSEECAVAEMPQSWCIKCGEID